MGLYTKIDKQIDIYHEVVSLKSHFQSKSFIQKF